MSVEGEPLADTDRDIVQVRVTSVDEEGNFYPYGENRIDFHVIGHGKEEEIVLKPVWHFRNNWKYFKTKGQLGAGANDIRLTPLGGNGLCLDELIVK